MASSTTSSLPQGEELDDELEGYDDVQLDGGDFSDYEEEGVPSDDEREGEESDERLRRRLDALRGPQPSSSASARRARSQLSAMEFSASVPLKDISTWRLKNCQGLRSHAPRRFLLERDLLRPFA